MIVDAEGTLIGWAAVITAFGGAIAAIVAALNGRRAARTSEQIRKEIQTGDGQAIGPSVRSLKENGGVP